MKRIYIIPTSNRNNKCKKKPNSAKTTDSLNLPGFIYITVEKFMTSKDAEYVFQRVVRRVGTK